MGHLLVVVEHRGLFRIFLGFQYCRYRKSVRFARSYFRSSARRRCIAAHQSWKQWRCCKLGRIRCTLYIGSLVGRSPLSRLYASGPGNSSGLLASSLRERDNILGASHELDRRYSSSLFGLDLGGNLCQVWQFVRYHPNTCLLEFSCLSWILVGAVTRREITLIAYSELATLHQYIISTSRVGSYSLR